MKRLFAFLLALIMTVSLCACEIAEDDMIEAPEKEERVSLREKRDRRDRDDEDDEEEAREEAPAEVPAETPAATEAPATEIPNYLQLLPKTTLPSRGGYWCLVEDSEDLYLAITGVGDNDGWGYSLNVLAENRSENTTYSIDVDTAAVNRLECYPYFSMELEPGEQKEGIIGFDAEELNEWGVSYYTDIALDFRVYDDDSWDMLFQEKLNYYPTGGETNAEVFEREQEPSDYVLCDNEYLTAIATGYYSDDYYAYVIGIYLVNKTDNELMFSLDEAYINGIECDPLYATTVAPGCRKFSDIGWYQEDFEDSAILVLSTDDVAKAELHFKAYNNDDWYEPYYLDETFVLEPAD